VHHDLWDYDLAAPPVLVTLTRDGKKVDAVAQPTKSGFVFVLDRETGAPLFPVEERPAPPSDLPGERAWPTQPVPLAPPPLVPQRLDEDALYAPTSEHVEACRAQLAEARNDGLFTPPSLRGSLVYPFVGGGANWSGAAWDPARQLLVVPVQNLAQVIRLERATPQGVIRTTLWWLLALVGSRQHYQLSSSSIEFDGLLQHDGVPCNRPPWGLLVGVDLARGAIAWSASTSVGNDDPGGRSYGPPLATASGLVFHAGTERPVLRVHDSATGERIATFELPAGLHAGPISYRLRHDGKQFLVVAPGGHAVVGSPFGDYVIAYALPDGVSAPAAPRP
jgi:quinoprotein glucose dehydrogenase